MQAIARAVSVITTERVASFYLTRYNPVKNLTPQTLVSALDGYYAGRLRRLALIMERIEDVDDVVKIVAAKAKKQPGTRGWEIIAEDDSPEAATHKEALENFYNRLTVTNAIDGDVRGEVNLLLYQMMDAKAKGYACHEILWDPQPGYLTAELRFVPLWFFERTQGHLRFLEGDHDIYGVDLEPGRWLITQGDGLMRACAIAYLYKQMPLKDWLIYCGRHGMPLILGKTHATYDSPEWQAMETAVSQVSAEYSAVMSADDAIDSVDTTAKGELPHPKLVERMDRTMAAIWRGADLSTISSGQGAEGTGASLQGEEAELIAAADAEMLSDTLRRTIDRVVIKWATGADAPKAYFAIKGVTKDTTELDLKVDKQLHEMRFPISTEDLANRYGRSLPDSDENLLPPPAAQSGALQLRSTDEAGRLQDAAANQRTEPAGPDHPVVGQLLANARLQLAEARQQDLLPLAERLNGLYILAEGEELSEDELRGALVAFRTELPELMQRINLDPQAVSVFADTMSAAVIDGMAMEAAAQQRGQE